jgi:hypothetical protein
MNAEGEILAEIEKRPSFRKITNTKTNFNTIKEVP